MKKTYCDCCEKEITPDNVWRDGHVGDAHFSVPVVIRSEVAVPYKSKVEYRVQVFGDFASEAGADVCRYCIIDAMRKLDDRPSCGTPAGVLTIIDSTGLTKAQLDEEKNKHAAEQVKGAGVMILRHLRAMEHDQRGMSPPSFEQCIEAVRVITGCPLP